MDEKYIPVEAAIAVLHESCEGCPGNGKPEYCGICPVKSRIKRIRELEAADVQPVKHEHWELFTDAGGHDDIRCSGCKETPHWTNTAIEAAPPYCPNCGAEVSGFKLLEDY